MPAKPKSLVVFDRGSRSSWRDFFDWIEKNEDGFFLNTYQEASERYVVLHGAKCGTTSPKRYGTKGATQGKYKKICSTNSNELFDYLEQKEGVSRKKIRFCKRCSSRNLNSHLSCNVADEITDMAGEELGEEGRKRLVSHLASERNPKNRKIVLKDRSKPYACEACGLSLSVYGSEYESLIHVHHVLPVGQGVRIPTKEDFLLLCPNCHAVAHWKRATNPLNFKELKHRAVAVRARWAKTP